MTFSPRVTLTRLATLTGCVLTLSCAPAVVSAAPGPSEAVAGTSVHDQARTVVPPLTRDQITTRGKSWLDSKVLYNKGLYFRNQYGSYRQDCSGYVSMAWGLSESLRTKTLHTVSTPIPFAEMKPGDAFLRPTNDYREGHVLLFVKWADAEHTKAVVRHNDPDPVVGERRNGVREEVMTLKQIQGYDMHGVKRNNNIENPASPRP